MKEKQFIEMSNSFFIDDDFQPVLKELGLTSFGSVFLFSDGKNLSKDNLAKYRSRLQFQTEIPKATFFLKRYNVPSVLAQIKNWISHHHRISFALCEVQPAKELYSLGINTPKIAGFGQQWGVLFEKRSFVITEEIPNAVSLERKLPDYFDSSSTDEKIRFRKDFIIRLADFIKKFHKTNYRHRDLYLSHIFYDENQEFHLIDLARAFKPLFFHRRFQIKDIAQLYYSAPGKYFSKSDRLRFYLAYTGRKKITRKDKAFIKRLKHKVRIMAKHNLKHNRPAPFAS